VPLLSSNATSSAGLTWLGSGRRGCHNQHTPAKPTGRKGPVSGSPTRPGRATRCWAGRCRPTWPPPRARTVWWPRPGWKGPTPTGSTSCARSGQQPAAQPGRAQGRRRHRRRQRPGGPAAFPFRHGGSAAGAVHGRAGRVRGRGGPGRHPRVGGPANPGIRADPVPPGHTSGPAGPAAAHPAGDQQVLRAGPGPRPEHGGVPGQPGPAGVHGLLAQPRHQARPLGPRHLRSGRPGRHGRDHADHRQRPDGAGRDLLRRHHRRHGGRQESLGRPAAEHRDDVELALRVSRWLGSSVLQPSPDRPAATAGAG
jgi:hypothetical protein